MSSEMQGTQSKKSCISNKKGESNSAVKLRTGFGVVTLTLFVKISKFSYMVVFSGIFIGYWNSTVTSPTRLIDVIFPVKMSLLNATDWFTI
jgi:hypothetical protein